MSFSALGKVAGWPIPYRLQGLAFRLADFHNAESGVCCPSLERLAQWGQCP